MKNRTVPNFLVTVFLVLVSRMAAAQMGNGTYTLLQETTSSAGGRIGGGNPMAAQTVLGLPAGGLASNGTFILIGGGGRDAEPDAEAPVAMTITVTGTIDDPAASVTVNGTAAALDAAAKTFNAPGIVLALGPNTITVTATDALGNAASRAITVYLDLPAAKKLPRFSITVTGTVDDLAASVTVNGIQAGISGGQFSASVPLVSGLNTLTAAATDVWGRTGTTSIRVVVPSPHRPPPRPTVGTVGEPIPAVTTASSITIGGTKTHGTSIWINGKQVAGLSDELTWTAIVTLVEGDNELLVVAKDAGGTESAETRVLIIVDNLPPVVTFQPPAKTNFNLLLVTGSVDDSLTTVTINGLAASRTKRAFEVSVPLALGPNTLHLVATSPNKHVTTKDYPVTLGTIPTIQAVQPTDGAKLYVAAAATLQGAAVDAENDPVEYQILLDSQVLKEWSSQPSLLWTPPATALGVHAVEVRARDGFGGHGAQQTEVFVLNKPVSP